MKTWLRRLFYLDEPAQGAFFALTLWAAGYYYLFTLVAIALENGKFPELIVGVYSIFSILSGAPWFFLFGLVFFPLCSLCMLLHLFDRRFKHRHAVWLGFGGTIVLSFGLYVLFPALNPAWSFAVPAVFGLSLLVLCGKCWYFALGAVLSSAVGSGMIFLPFGYPSPFYICDKLGAEPYPAEWFVSVQRFFGLGGSGWMLWIAVGLLFWLSAYMLSAGLLAWLGNKSFRSMFDRRVVVLLASAGVIYLTFLGMILAAKQKCAGEIAALERHFGRPVSAEVLKRFYYDGATGDSEHWKKLDACLEKIADLRGNNSFSAYANHLAAISDTDFKRLREQWHPSEKALQEVELMFSRPIPLPVLDFSPGKLMEEELSHYSALQAFYGCELWQIRFLLADGKVKAALEAYDRITRANRFLLKDVFLYGLIVWQRLMDFQLDAMQLFLESGKLSDDELRRLADELPVFEAEAAGLQSRCLYGEAVYALDCFKMLAGGCWHFPSEGDCGTPMPLKAVRFFVPQFWWFFLRDEAEVARCFRVADYRAVASSDKRKELPAIGQQLMPSPDIATRFDKTIARLRAMRGLIMAEEYKRKHGNYPETIPNLPLDPFSGKPLLYRRGICPYRDLRLAWMLRDDKSAAGEGYWNSEIKNTEIPAIQVWSVGPDRVDSGGVYDYKTKADDVRAIMRSASAHF